MYVHKRFLTYVLLAAVAITGLQCSDDDSSENQEPKDTGKSITSFKFAALTPAITATVNESAKTVSVNVPAGTNVTALVPTVELSASATVNPASGAAQNFTTPVTYTVTAEDGTKQAYVVTVTVATSTEVTCYPTSLPASDAMTVDVTYTANHQVAAVKYTYTEDDEVYEYSTEHEYNSDGKISRINFTGDDATSYLLFTYGNNTITEDKYEDVNEDGVHEKTTYFIYTLTNGRVTSWEYHSANGEPGKTLIESATYTYTGDNVTTMDGFGADGTLAWHHTYEYDTKTNPFYQSNLNASGNDDGYFDDPSNLSKNNISFWDSHGTKGYKETIVYTYDVQGLPLTKKINDEDARSYEYDCR